MRRVDQVLYVALLGLLGAIAYSLMQSQPTQELADTAPTSALQDQIPSVGTKADSDGPASIGPNDQTVTPDCLSWERLQDHPVLSEEVARFDSIAVTGPTIASYRGLDDSSLESFAAQGDSAAMAVLGAISMLKARNMQPHHAVPYLLFEDGPVRAYITPSMEDPKARQHYSDARDWFYKSALHGRLLALYWYGEITGSLEGGAVGLGWTDQATFEALPSAQQVALWPSTVYSLLAFEIAPKLRTGVGEMYYDLLPKHEFQPAVLEKLAVRFEQDRIAQRLPPIELPTSVGPPWAQVEEMLCEPVSDYSK